MKISIPDYTVASITQLRKIYWLHLYQDFVPHSGIYTVIPQLMSDPANEFFG